MPLQYRLPVALFPLALATGMLLHAQASDANVPYRIYHGGDGTPATLDSLLADSSKSEVTFLGEVHNDPTAHALELQILSGNKGDNLALSLEMFERDVQSVLDEYLAGLVAEKNFVKESRAWPNYKEDYRPLIEYAREHHLPVVAANAPGRYVNRVSRLGADSLSQLDEHARSFLPPLPYSAASDAYATRFRKQMENHDSVAPPTPPKPSTPSHETAAAAPSAPPPPPMDMNKALQAQSLWDATMGFSLADYLTRHPAAHMVQVNGGFHSSEHLGTAEQLQHYRPGTHSLVVTMLPSTNGLSFDKTQMKDEGDYVIVTNGSLIKTSDEPAPPAAAPKSNGKPATGK